MKAANRDDELDMLPEYHFDYTRAKPNRFASKASPDHLMVTLDPDVAGAFPNSETVNRALRAIMSALPASQVKR